MDDHQEEEEELEPVHGGHLLPQLTDVVPPAEFSFSPDPVHGALELCVPPPVPAPSAHPAHDDVLQRQQHALQPLEQHYGDVFDLLLHASAILHHAVPADGPPEPVVFVPVVAHDEPLHPASAIVVADAPAG